MKKFVSFMLIIVAAFAFSICISPKKGILVETEEQAIIIAKEYVLKKYEKTFEDEYEIYARLDGKNWYVWYLKGEEKNSSGGPSLCIRKYDGKVTKCYLQ